MTDLHYPNILKRYQSQDKRVWAYMIAGMIIIANPITWWASKSIMTIGIIPGSILLHVGVLLLYQSGFAKGALITAASILLFTLCTPFAFLCLLPIATCLPLISSHKALQAHMSSLYLIIFMPSIIFLICLVYWNWFYPDPSWSLTSMIENAAISTLWHSQTGGTFATGTALAILWGALLTPLVLMRAITTWASPSARQAIFTLLFPALALGIASQFAPSLTPLPIMAIFVTSQIFNTTHHHSGMAILAGGFSCISGWLAVSIYA